MYRVEVSIVDEGELTPLAVKVIRESVVLTALRDNKTNALAFALDALVRLAGQGTASPLVDAEQQGRTEDAREDAQQDALSSESRDALVPTIAAAIHGIISEVVADPAGRWFNGNANQTDTTVRRTVREILNRDVPYPERR